MNILGHRVEPRVGQLDASILDAELVSLLKDELWKGFKIFRPHVTDKYENELLLLLKLALFKVTVWDHSTTYGAKLQNMKLVHSASTARNHIAMTRNQKMAYGFLIVGGSYVWNKVDDYVTQHAHESERLQKVRDLLDKLSLTWSVSSLANFVLFLYSGKYSTLIMRILKIRFIPVSKSIRREVNFEFQNRQLVWNALTEFLLFILPIINIRKVKRSLTRVISGSATSKKQEGELAFLPLKTCANCYKIQTADSSSGLSSTAITNPYQGECGHVYCYVCLKSKVAEDEDGWPCLRCGKSIKSIKPYLDIDSRAVVTVKGACDKQKSEKRKFERPSGGATTVAPVDPEATPKEDEKPAADNDDDEDYDDDDVDVEDYDDEPDDDGGEFIVDDTF